MKQVDKTQWLKLWEGIRELADLVENRQVFIGGVAVYLHVTEGTVKKTPPTDLVEFSHDGDFYISLEDFGTLRDYVEVTKNKRLNKHQVIKHGIDFDVYLEKNNSLRIKFEDVYAESVVLAGVRAACLEHLLLLKLAAYEDRQGSSKGEKDERDIIRIMYLLSLKRADIKILIPYITEEDTELLERVHKSSEFLTLAKRNSYNAKRMRVAYNDSLTDILAGFEENA